MSKYRDLRFLETAPDAYVPFDQRQRQWAFSYHHPRLWAIYRALAKLRCLIADHEMSPIIEHEKFDLSRLGHGSTNCVFCGREQPQ